MKSSVFLLLLSASVCAAIPQVKINPTTRVKLSNLSLRGGGKICSLGPRDGLAIVHVAGTMNGLQCFFAPKVTQTLTGSQELLVL